MLLTDLEILTMVPGAAPLHGAIRVRGTEIVATGDLASEPGEDVVALPGLTALPGFVQGHVHLCQTLFRNLAEGLPLLEWLEQRIWPLEAAHDEESLRASARLALYELARGGCTTFQSMETVHGTETVFEEVRASGMRGVLGNAMMDTGTAPPGLRTSTASALATADGLRADWDGKDDRVFFAFNPRFILSCSDELHREIAMRRESSGARVHTHAAEHPSEVEAVRSARGKRYVLALEELGLLGPTTSLAHCVHVDDAELRVLADTGTAVLHCPSTNLKLGSGIAPVTRLGAAGVALAIGSDGAPANNRLDCLTELRQGALLQELVGGPGSLSAFDALSLLTREGARALGFGALCGTIEAGKSADLVLLDLRDPALGPGGDAYTRIVFGADRSHVRHVLCRGEFLVRDGAVARGEPDGAAAAGALSRLLRRAGLAR